MQTNTNINTNTHTHTHTLYDVDVDQRWGCTGGTPEAGLNYTVTFKVDALEQQLRCQITTVCYSQFQPNAIGIDNEFMQTHTKGCFSYL